MTKQETLFLTRAATVAIENPEMTFEQAMRATLEREKELHEMFDKNTERGREMRAQLAKDIWHSINGKKS